MSLIQQIKKKIKNLFNPDELTRLRRRHNAGNCHKSSIGYTCRGSNDFKECGNA